MVRVEHVDKYFFPGRRNEIHAVNDANLEMGENQLVAILGPSGGGKTTLLNLIGGLDEADDGEIYVDGERITGRSSAETDRIRTLKIGYIFQDYQLLENETVYENVAIALRMIGMKDEEEIRSQVEYVLEKVGMFRCRNRQADTLSGGERQRVGIARAIVKNPSIIIADEPTGNLDSRNTLEVMNLIRNIASERLVILVTHEEELARYYADRIIRIRDGKILSDEWNRRDQDLDYRVDNRIFLRDIQDHQRLDTGRYDLHFYNKGGDVRLNIVVDGNNIYIQPRDPMANVEIVDGASPIEIFEGSERDLTEEQRQSRVIDLSRLDSFSRRRYTSFLSLPASIRRGFQTMAAYPAAKKILLGGFFLSAAVITFAMAVFFGVFQVDDSKFATTDRDYVLVSGSQFTPDVFSQWQEDAAVQSIIPGDSIVTMRYTADDLYQTSRAGLDLTGSLADISRIDKGSLLCGRMPENEGEIVVDRLLVDRMIAASGLQAEELGIRKGEDMLDRQLSVPNVGSYRIVGISDGQAPDIYTAKSQFPDIAANSISDREDYRSEKERENKTPLVSRARKPEAELVQGSWPKAAGEVVCNYWTSRDTAAYAIGSELEQTAGGEPLRVVGYYSDEQPTSSYYIATEQTLLLAAVDEKRGAAICPEGSSRKNLILSMLREQGFSATDAYDRDRRAYLQENRNLMLATLLLSGIMILVSFLEGFLMIRASFLSRIREVGTYRAIGVKKRDIYKMFSGEILAIFFTSSLPGFLLAALAVVQLAGNPLYAGYFYAGPGAMILSLAVILCLNLLFGLLPVWRTIRRTPARILTGAR